MAARVTPLAQKLVCKIEHDWWSVILSSNLKFIYNETVVSWSPLILWCFQPEQRSKLDPSDDSLFYDVPRLVTHVDEGFIQRLTDLVPRATAAEQPYF